MADLSFEPRPARTAAVDAAIRLSLADSIATVMSEIMRSGIKVGGDISAWRQHLLEHAAPSNLWACYHDLVQAIVRLDEAAVPTIASELVAMLPAALPVPGVVVTLSDADLGQTNVRRYIAVIDNDAGNPLCLLPATREEVARIAALAVDARDLLAEASPALLDEIDTLGHDIVLAGSGGARGFGGAATVFLWGAVILNPMLVPDRVTMVEALAHETAHALLFGLTLGIDLTTNDPGERYSSPLRQDPRPIEGIVHATFVLARMIYVLDQINHSARLTETERAALEARIARNQLNYANGLETVDAHARFTPAGAEIMSACRAAMHERNLSA